MTRLAAGGGSLVYSTFVGGSAPAPAWVEGAEAVTVDANGVATVVGTTMSTDFPTTTTALARQYAGGS